MKKAKDKKAATAAAAKKPAKKTAPVKPVAKKPAAAAKKPVAKPSAAPAKPPVAKASAAKPGTDKSASAKSAAAKPAAKAPASAKPAPAKAPAAKPAAKAPAIVTTKPATPPPAAKKPAEAKAAGTKPENTKPEAVKPEAKTESKAAAAKAPVRPLAVSAAPTRPLPQPIKPVDHRPAAQSKIVQPKTVLAKVKVDFSAGDHVVYPTHGVGKVLRIERQSIAGFELDLMVVEFERDKMTVRIPLTKVQSVGIRKLSTPLKMRTALDTLKGRARIKRAMWSRRAQEYEAKINSGDPVQIAEVVRDLHRNAGQPDQSYSERQIYESALDRLVRELAAVERIDEDSAAKKLDKYLKAA